MEELRLAFLVIGACAIAGILFHGLWSVRKNASRKEAASLETPDWQDSQDDVEDIEIEDLEESEPKFSVSEFDDLGLGPVKAVGSEDNENIDTQETTAEAKPKIYSSVVTQPKPEYAAEQVEAMRSRVAGQKSNANGEIPEPPPFLLKTDNVNTSATTVPEVNSSADELLTANHQPSPQESLSVPEKVSLANQVKGFVKQPKTEPKTYKRQEPKLKQPDLRADQMRIDFDEPILDLSDEERLEAQENEDSANKAPQQEVLVLNVKAPQDNLISGAALLPMLLTLGFKFGDQDIFHRHVNSNGKGPVLFSLANMFKPGVFDIDNLENFNTQGVSLFMMLPIEGDPHQVFNMMHNAARKISEEFTAVVLDGRRNPLTKQGLQQYVEKIREFERQRLINR